VTNGQNDERGKSGKINVMVPLSILKQAAEADALIREVERETAKRGGRPRTTAPKPMKYVGFIADTQEETDARMQILERVAGARGPGKKRRGQERMAFCADLITCFLELRLRGIKPPRGGSLSVKAFVFGVADVLIRHGEMDENDYAATVKNSDRRRTLGRKHADLFGDIIREIEERYPS